MPSTVEVINYLKLQAEGWNRTGEKGLLEVLGQTQDILYKSESAQTMAFTTSGALPVLATTAGTYQYTLNQATTGLSDDIWRVAQVVVKPPFSNQLLAAIRVEYGITPNLRQPVHQMEFNGVEYFRFFQVATVDAKRGGHPTLTFTLDPGTTTDDFYLVAHYKPTELTSENIELTIPEHLHITHVMPAAMKLIEGYENGNIIEAMAYIKKEIAPDIQQELNKGDQGESHSVTRFEE